MKRGYMIAVAAIAAAGGRWTAIGQEKNGDEEAVDQTEVTANTTSEKAIGNEQGKAKQQNPQTVSRDSRVDYGEFKISRMRLEQSNAAPVGVQQNAKAAPGEQTRVSDAIVVPRNTMPILTNTEESASQQADRQLAQRRILEAQAEREEAQAQIARSEAIRAQDESLSDGVVIFHHGRVYTGRRVGILRPVGGKGAAEAKVIVERFVGDRAIWDFADAATPRVKHATDQMHDAQRAWSKAAQLRITDIQKRVDQAQIDLKLKREKVQPDR